MHKQWENYKKELLISTLEITWGKWSLEYVQSHDNWTTSSAEKALTPIGCDFANGCFQDF